MTANLKKFISVLQSHPNYTACEKHAKISLLKEFENFCQQADHPKYRLVPRANKKYNLERWNCELNMYTAIQVDVTPQYAEKCIKNLEREVIYFLDAPK